MRVLTAGQIRQAEEQTVRRGMSRLRLMENAGAAAAKAIREACPVDAKRVAVLCGQGNNGGDGYVVARKLQEHGARVTVIRVLGLPMTPECEEMCRKVLEVGLPVCDLFSDEADCAESVAQADLIVDAVFGTGFHGQPDPTTATFFTQVNRAPGFVAAIDLPSGLDCDSGRAQGLCIHADLTVSFSAYKPCHFLADGIDACGRVAVAEIGIPADLLTYDGAPEVFDADAVRESLPPRRRSANKGDFGKALLVCGSYGMAGAAILAARASLRCGVGLVRLALPRSIYPIVAAAVPEAVCLPLPETDRGTLSADSLPQLCEAVRSADALLFGPGVGRGGSVEALLEAILQNARCPVVLDADGINALSTRIHWIEQANAPLLLTPHPGEMARLCGTDIPTVQADRLGCATRFAQTHRVTLVLKGAGTVTALPNGRAIFNPTGNPGMATGGSGDALAGMLTSLLAQGLPADRAAPTAVWLHGAAGDAAAEKGSLHGLTPSDCIEALPRLFSSFER